MSLKTEKHVYRMCRRDAEPKEMLLAECKMTQGEAERMNLKVKENSPYALWSKID
jgi:hypothetical protein